MNRGNTQNSEDSYSKRILNSASKQPKLQFLNQVEIGSNNFDEDILEPQDGTARPIIEINNLELSQDSSPRKFKLSTYKTVPKEQNSILSTIPQKLRSIKNAILAKIFIDRLKERIESQRFKRLKNREYDLIGDPTYFPGDAAIEQRAPDTRGHFDKMMDLIGLSNDKASDVQKKQMQMFNQIRHQKIKLLEEKHIIGVFDVNSDYIRMYEALMSIIIPFLIWTLSLENAIYNVRFHEEFGYAWTAILLIGLCSFGVHIGIKLNTSFYECGQLVNDRMSITQNYIKKYLIYDALAVWSFIQSYFIIFDNSQILYYLNLLIILQVISWNEIMNQIIEMMHIKNYLTGLTVMKLYRLIFMILFVGHIFSLIHIIMVEEEIKNGETSHLFSMIDEELTDSQWIQKYVWIFYYNITTMTTVGYGDISPINALQAGIQCFILIFSVSFYSYCFGLVGALIQSIHDQEMEFNGKMSELTKYFRQKNVPYSVQASVRQYYAYVLKNRPTELDKHTDDDEQILQVIEKLGPEIKNTINLITHMQYFQNCPLLKDHFSNQFLEAIALECEPQSYQIGDLIFNDDWNEDECCLFFVEKGQIDLYVEFEKMYKDSLDREQEVEERFVLQSVEKGGCFGESSFILENKKNFKAIAKTNCRVLWLSQGNFMKILRAPFFRADFEIYFNFRDKIVYNQSYSLINEPCFICQSLNHEFSVCPRVKFTPNIERLIHNVKDGDDKKNKIKQQGKKENEIANAQDNVQNKDEDILISKENINEQTGNQIKRKKKFKRKIQEKFKALENLESIKINCEEVRKKLEGEDLQQYEQQYNFDHIFQAEQLENEEQQSGHKLNQRISLFKGVKRIRRLLPPNNNKNNNNNNNNNIEEKQANTDKNDNEKVKELNSESERNKVHSFNQYIKENNREKAHSLSQIKIELDQQSNSVPQIESEKLELVPLKSNQNSEHEQILKNGDAEEIQQLLRQWKDAIKQRHDRWMERNTVSEKKIQQESATSLLLNQQFNKISRRNFMFPESTFDKLSVFTYYQPEKNVQDVQIEYNLKNGQKN